MIVCPIYWHLALLVGLYDPLDSILIKLLLAKSLPDYTTGAWRRKIVVYF